MGEVADGYIVDRSSVCKDTGQALYCWRVPKRNRRRLELPWIDALHVLNEEMGLATIGKLEHAEPTKSRRYISCWIRQGSCLLGLSEGRGLGCLARDLLVFHKGAVRRTEFPLKWRASICKAYAYGLGHNFCSDDWRWCDKCRCLDV